MCVALVWCSRMPAQSVTANLKADSTRLQIGDHLNITLEVKYNKAIQFSMPVLKDTLGTMEIVEIQKTDTSFSGDIITLKQNIITSAYDSGIFRAGPLSIIAGSDTIISNQVFINVNTLAVDTAKPFKPIKAPLKVDYEWKEFLWLIIPLLFLIGIAIAGYIMWKQQKNKKQIAYTRPVPKDPPHIWALKELKKVEEEKLWQQDKVKEYYSRLSDILRLYLEYRYRWFAMEDTTEVIEKTVSNYINKDKAKEMLLQVLRSADMVKFAKDLPMPNSNISAMETAVKFIEWTQPAETETKKEA